MANFIITHNVVVWFVLLMLIAIADATPPGIANNPSHARCLIKKYKYCYNLEHVCPKFCPDSCTVECVSCKPMCDGSAIPPTESPTPEPPTDSQPPPTPLPPTLTPSPPTPTPSPPTPTPSPPTPTPTLTPSPLTPTPSPPIPTPTPLPSTPTPSIPTPSTPASPPPPSSLYPTPPTTTPSPPTTTPTPPSSWTPPPQSESASASRAKCKNRNYPQCYNVQHVCPSACPTACEVDCVTCKPVCNCDRPGAVCQDPRFIGGDGITFYFHGKKDQDFCLVSDPSLHINAHFIGKRSQNMKRDFTWVQSLGILFDNHKLSVSAQKTSTWDEYINRLKISFDEEHVRIPETKGATWQSETVPRTSITRISNTNDVVIKVDGIFKITAKVVPITGQESQVHNYGITQEDCFAHLDLGFKFYSLSHKVAGVLGHTYRYDYVSGVNVGASMPVMGGEKEFATSSLFATDCAVALFGQGHSSGTKAAASSFGLELPSLRCSSVLDGGGVVCKR